MREIGSEFWMADTTEKDMHFFLSGRTALEFIIRDILAEREVTAVHLPSYCCHTMIEPFLRHQIPVRFYDVVYKDGLLVATIPKVNANEIYFHMQYFGFHNPQIGDLAEIKKSGCITIEDATHSWLADSLTSQNAMLSDYRFTSYRKWTGLTGIATAEKNTLFSILPNGRKMESFDFLRTQAQNKKDSYMKGKHGDKDGFLKQFGEADALLKENYIDMLPSYESIKKLACLDKEWIQSARYANASILYQGISEISQIITMFPVLQEGDAPLCVPVLLAEEIRDDFRKFLISKAIYCPIHWPLSQMHDGISEKAKQLYGRELSLVCDQRYGKADMERFLQCIKEYFGV